LPAFTHHIFICSNQRSLGHRRGCCDPDGSQSLRNAFKTELKRRGLGSLVRANKAGCLDQCEHGPTVVVYPQGVFYGGVTLADVPRIVEETVIAGRVIEELRISDSCLNNPDCRHIQKLREESMEPDRQSRQEDTIAPKTE
jgi:(2Fe-2S) ferredoxin